MQVLLFFVVTPLCTASAPVVLLWKSLQATVNIDSLFYGSDFYRNAVSPVETCRSDSCIDKRVVLVRGSTRILFMPRRSRNFFSTERNPTDRSIVTKRALFGDFLECRGSNTAVERTEG